MQPPFSGFEPCYKSMLVTQPLCNLLFFPSAFQTGLAHSFALENPSDATLTAGGAGRAEFCLKK